MSIIRGLLSQNLPWGSSSWGVHLGDAGAVRHQVALLRRRVVLPIQTTAPIFVGGIVRWWVERKTGQRDESEISSGTLFSSGLIAGGSLAGILYAALYGNNLLPAADDAETVGLIPFCTKAPSDWWRVGSFSRRSRSSSRGWGCGR